jgi:hypothetical protein
MRTLLLICFCFPLALSVASQKTTVPDPKFGSGGTKTTTVTDNGLGIRITTEEYTDGGEHPNIVYKIEKTENLIEKETTIKTTSYTTFDKPPKLDFTIEVKTNAQGDTVYREDIHYIEGAIFDGSSRSIRLPDGRWERYRYNGKTREFELLNEPVRRIKENGKIGYLAGNGEPKTTAFLGYSYLSTSEMGNSESFPAGVHAAFTYFMVSRWGLIADASIHSKKENEFRITRAFLLGGLQYNLLKHREKTLILPLLRVLAGLAMDKQKFSSGDFSNTDKASAFAIGGGCGLYCELNRRIAIAMIADYIHTQFGQESQNNIRASLGLTINMGCLK